MGSGAKVDAGTHTGCEESKEKEPDAAKAVVTSGQFSKCSCVGYSSPTSSGRWPGLLLIHEDSGALREGACHTWQILFPRPMSVAV